MIRKAAERDVPELLRLLSQVLAIHAKIRPDIFISGTTKYTEDELICILQNDLTPVYVAVSENDEVVGYAFCMIRTPQPRSNLVFFRSFFVDDLCVDEKLRGQHIGEELFLYLKEEARRLGCYEVTLNVWEGNDSAKKFYEKMGMKPKETQMEIIL